MAVSRTVNPLISIVIPTKNSSSWLDELLPALAQQDLDDFEVIMVDSGSKDDTEKKALDYGARFYKMPRFGHGLTRNYGASLAKGGIIVFNNHDAIPLGKGWLRTLVAPLSRRDIVASYARSIPRTDTHAAERFFLLTTYPPKSRMFSKSDLNKLDTRRDIVFSTVSGAIRKEIWATFKFNEQAVIGEDHELGLRLLKAGLKIAYKSEARVLHSHNFTAWDAFRRFNDFGRNDRVMGERRNIQNEDLMYLLLLAKDTALYAGEHEGVKGVLYSLVYVCAKASGYSVGTYSNYLPTSLRNLFSYTAFVTSR